MLVDKKILAGGLAMILAGIILLVAVSPNSAMSPAGHSGMTEEEVIDLLVAEDENQAYQMLSGILIGVGFLLVLISFGAKRKKSDKITIKKIKPAE